MAEMMKVLVAEDNKELCAQAAAALRGYGCTGTTYLRKTG